MHLHGPVTVELTASREYENPLHGPDIKVTFVAPSGYRRTVPAFWDGGLRWLARIEAVETGPWAWNAQCPDGETCTPAQGQFLVEPYDGENPLYRHGAVTVGLDGYRLAHRDGAPFFWFADTAWDALLCAEPTDWRHYLRTRIAQGITAAQCVMTHWRGSKILGDDRLAFFGTENIRLNPAFYQRIDQMVETANQEGMLLALVVLWAWGPNDPGNFLPEDDWKALAKYIVARYAAYQIVWFLAGDGKYQDESAERWRKLGRDVFDPAGDRLATMHPCGESWFVEEFRNEPWYRIATWQSGHGDSDKTVRWLTAGPHVTAWRTGKPMPYIDLEPRYESHAGYTHKKIFDDHDVRKGLWWNLFMKPTAGVTYGNHGIWPWAETREVPPGHPYCNPTPTWREGLVSPAALQFPFLRRFFHEARWFELMPAPHLLAQQPGENENPNRTIAATHRRDGSFFAAYLPHGEEIHLRPNAIAANGRAAWFDPRTGIERDAGPYAPASATVFSAPDDRDWILVLRRT